jgi:hypothetical protein
VLGLSGARSELDSIITTLSEKRCGNIEKNVSRQFSQTKGKVKHMTGTDLREMHYNDISDMLDDYSEDDRAFMLWLLLQDYINSIEEEQKNYDESKATVRDYALQVMLGKHKTVAEEMREVLYYKWS